jgi:uncharacterized protein
MDSAFVTVNGKKMEVLLAISEEEQRRGLMHRDAPIPNMAFLYSYAGINSFWMKDTRIPLDLVFCLKNKIIAIRSGEPYSLSVIGSDVISDLVVEFPAGTCRELSIRAGDDIQVELANSTRMKLFMAKNGLH